MNAKPVLRRKSARIDIDLAADHYEQEAGQDVALRFADAVEAAFRVIGERPGSGSSRWAERLGIAGLRSRPVARFPYLISIRSTKSMSQFGACFMPNATFRRR